MKTRNGMKAQPVNLMAHMVVGCVLTLLAGPAQSELGMRSSDAVSVVQCEALLMSSYAGPVQGTQSVDGSRAAVEPISYHRQSDNKSADLKRQYQRTERLLRQSGYRDFAEFQREIDLLRDRFPYTYDMIASEKVEFAIHAPEKYRENISREGIRHALETGNNYADQAAYVTTRDLVEAKFLDIDPQDYATWSPRLKPKYGLLRPAPGTGLRPHLADQYGTDVWIVRKDRARAFTTFTFGDSLNSVGMMRQLLLWKFGDKAPFIKASSWYSRIFIPWTMKELMVPVLELGVSRSNTHTLEVAPVYKGALSKWFMTKAIKHGDEAYQREFIKMMEGLPTIKDYAMPRYDYASPVTFPSYLELQIWRPLDHISNFEKLIFYGQPPAPEIYTRLKQAGVAVMDGRDQTRDPVPWQPDSN